MWIAKTITGRLKFLVVEMLTEWAENIAEGRLIFQKQKGWDSEVRGLRLLQKEGRNFEVETKGAKNHDYRDNYRRDWSGGWSKSIYLVKG